MANWVDLNKEFYDVLNSFKDDDWDSWDSVRASKKEMRRLELLLKAKIQEEKIKLSLITSQWNKALSQTINTSEITQQPPSVTNTQSLVCSEYNYALAA